MNTVATNYQVGQQFGSGKIVNPSQVKSEQLKDARLITVLVPNSLEKEDSVEVKTQESSKQWSMPSFDPLIAIDLLGGAVVGTLVGTVAKAAFQSSAVGLAVGVGAGVLAFTIGGAIGRI